MKDQEQEALIRGLQSGERDAFDSIFRAYYDPLVCHCVRFVVDADVANDIVQSFFVKLWAMRERLDIRQSLDSKFFSALQNMSITYINKERAHPESNEQVLNEEPAPEDPYSKLYLDDLEAAYQRIIAEMPEKRRQVFMLSRFDGLRNAEISTRLDLSVKTVEAHVTAALKQLRNGLKTYM